MAEDKNGLTKGLIIGLLIGGVVGAITALLYAPKSGRELRADIKKKATDLAENTSDIIKKAKSNIGETVNVAKSRSDQIVSEVKEKAGHIMDDAEKVLSEVRERVGSEGSKIKSAFRAGVDAYKSEKNREA